MCLIILAIALIVVGPKDLPKLLKQAGQFIGRMRSMANDFRTSFEDMARQSELEDLRKEVEAMRSSATQITPDHAHNQMPQCRLRAGSDDDAFDPYAGDPPASRPAWSRTRPGRIAAGRLEAQAGAQEGRRDRRTWSKSSNPPSRQGSRRKAAAKDIVT